MTVTTDKFGEILRQGSQSLGLELSEQELSALLSYHAMLVKWNQAYNLSAIRDPQEMLYKHLLDSLSIVPLLSEHPAQRLIDVGTGAGLPGIPLAICFPERQFTLLDSAGKKTRFLTQVKQALKLTNVSIENCRVENHQLREGYQVIISRAFASVADMVSWCSHLRAPDGEFWAMKGLFPDSELSALEKNYKVISCSKLDVPGAIGERCLLRINAER